MSNYCALADLLAVKTAAELAQIADLDNDGVADAAVVERACVNATDVINGYVKPRYTAATAPALLKTIAVRLALYYLHLDRNSLTEDISAQYDRDLRLLRDIAEGKASLGDPATDASGDRAAGAKVEADDRIFTRDKLQGW
jgi:phage gp36-like protein